MMNIGPYQGGGMDIGPFQSGAGEEAGATSISFSGSLFIEGLVNSHSGSIDLFTVGPLQSSGSIDLFITGPYPTGFSGSTDLFISSLSQSSGSINLFITSFEAESGIPLRIINRLTKTGDYDPQLVGIFTTSPSGVNIEVWDTVDGQNTQVTIANSGCYAIGNTGRWAWSTANLPFTNEHKKYQYYFRMTSNTDEKQYGEFFITVPERGRWSHP
ncbi:hypothetical protein LCGC14_0426340 [marine sediment metagenome]|uniref:Uncharacterized protein n=1 Tax=marine sediment metagenome TaxID=412755 RepID=A0A0F9VBD3_9ZZZZ